MTGLSESFWVAFIATISAMFGLSLRMCLRSRCDQVDCLCFKIHRDTHLEHDEAQNNHDSSTSDLELGEIYQKHQKITM